MGGAHLALGLMPWPPLVGLAMIMFVECATPTILSSSVPLCANGRRRLSVRGLLDRREVGEGRGQSAGGACSGSFWGLCCGRVDFCGDGSLCVAVLFRYWCHGYKTVASEQWCQCER